MAPPIASRIEVNGPSGTGVMIEGLLATEVRVVMAVGEWTRVELSTDDGVLIYDVDHDFKMAGSMNLVSMPLVDAGPVLAAAAEG